MHTRETCNPTDESSSAIQTHSLGLGGSEEKSMGRMGVLWIDFNDVSNQLFFMKLHSSLHWM